MSFHGLVNTAHFSEAAKDFRTNGGYYTRAPRGGREWLDYWDIQTKRCIEGYSVGGMGITGRHYFYLNFSPIWKVKDELVFRMMKEARDKRGNLSHTTAEKVFEFPRFYEISYEWYWFKHIAWYGGEFMGVRSTGGKHNVAGKTRGAGFSYMEASDGVYNYTFIPGSKNYYFAGIEQYLNVDGILNKAVPMMDWINAHCDVWKQNRQKVNSLQNMEFRASYVDHEGQEKGSFSEITGIVVDKPDKVRGKRGRKITFEEGGSFKNLLRALAITEGTIKDGGFYTGQISVFGTGGEEGPGIEGLEELFYNPEIYDFLAMPNIYDEDAEGTTCGYFVPVFRTNPLFMDTEGNVDMASNIEYELKEREKKKKSKKANALDMYTAEYPFSPREAFNRMKFSPFLSAACYRRIQKISKDPYIQSTIRYGIMDRDEHGVPIFIPQTQQIAKPILDYPHSQVEDLSGCVTIFEPPVKDLNNAVPHGRYQIVFDPYAYEESEDLTSLFAIYVLKNWVDGNESNQGLPVANYVGRPSSMDDIYDILFLLSDYYNAQIQGELPGGGQGVINHARKIHMLHRLCTEPETVLAKEFKRGQKNEKLLMTLPPEKKKMGLRYLVDWHKAPRSANANGKVLRTLDYINDVGLLLEMAKFDGKKNADRISAMIVGMFMLKENALRGAGQEQSQAEEEFYRRAEMSEEDDTISGYLTTY